MRTPCFSMLTFLALTMLCHAAQSQQLNLIGTWSTQVNTPQGQVASTLSINPDGTFVRADRIATGTMLRWWGQYRLQQTGPNSFEISTQIQGYLPHTSCVAISGFGQRCQPAPAPPQNPPATITMTSAMAIMAGGMMWQRDNSGGLLNVPVPDTAVVAGVAPTQPNIQQPVMPQLHPYVTPNGPGNQMANAYHQQSQNFINGYMRGCVKNQYGQWVGCQQ